MTNELPKICLPSYLVNELMSRIKRVTCMSAGVAPSLFMPLPWYCRAQRYRKPVRFSREATVLKTSTKPCGNNVCCEEKGQRTEDSKISNASNHAKLSISVVQKRCGKRLGECMLRLSMSMTRPKTHAYRQHLWHQLPNTSRCSRWQSVLAAEPL